MPYQEVLLTGQEMQSSIHRSSSQFSANDPVPFPFKTELSLLPLIEFWEENIWAGKPGLKNQSMISVREKLVEDSILRGPIADQSKLEPFEDLIDSLMTAVFPQSSFGIDLAAAVYPFSYRSFFRTPKYAELIPTEADMPPANLDEHSVSYLMVAYAYAIILHEIYGIDLDLDYPIIRTAKNPKTGLPFHFQIDVDPQFLKLRCKKKPPELSEAKRAELLANPTDIKTLYRILPPQHFEFFGFIVIRATDVTDQEVISSIKRDLIEQGSIASTSKLLTLQDKIRSLFRRTDLEISIAAIQEDQVWMLSSQLNERKDCIFKGTTHHPIQLFENTIWSAAVEKRRPLIIEDLDKHQEQSELQNRCLFGSHRNLVVAPLEHKGEVIGVLTISSPKPGDLNSSNSLKLREVLPLFALALRRSLDDFERIIQSVIKEKCTAIHPSVEWRFRKAAVDFLDSADSIKAGQMEAIVFDNVYPLFGATDIRGSSNRRNKAIQADLERHLRMARDVVSEARSCKALPIFEEIIYRIDHHLGQVQNGLKANDEVALLEFIGTNVEPSFEKIASYSPKMAERVTKYLDAMDPVQRTIYQDRKAFDDSVALINKTGSDLLEKEQEIAQSLFPHYFEKHTSDGIDHGIYVGEALVEGNEFDPIYLQNLRLWQLMVTCRIVNRMRTLKAEMPIPLETAHLIAVQHTPLAIRFRFEEKQFDVDGSYNIRYEIMKKRIDKAVIKGTTERLTQPGKIAIVYSHNREAIEYQRYIKFLQAKGSLTDELESVDLEDLQGIQGLRALRVSLPEVSEADQATDVKEIKEAVKGSFATAA